MVSRPASERADSTRRRILDSAAHCFAEFGFRKTTFEEIASGAGVSRTLLYTHFENKVGLLRAVRERALGEWADSVERRVEQSRTARGALEATVSETLRFANARPILRAFLSDDSRVALHGEKQVGRLSRDAWRSQIVAILQNGVETGEFNSDLDLQAAADVLRAMQLGMIDRLHHVGESLVVSTQAHVETACRILVDGVVGQSIVTRRDSTTPPNQTDQLEPPDSMRVAGRAGE